MPSPEMQMIQLEGGEVCHLAACIYDEFASP
jgi:hypothetical protein